jgi:hypothetical protein
MKPTDEVVQKLAQVETGMPVCDRTGKKIGRVVRVKIVEKRDESDDAFSTNQNGDEEWLELIADIIEPDDPHGIELATELWETGFVKVRGSRLKGISQYVWPHQIESVDDEGLHLNVIP